MNGRSMVKQAHLKELHKVAQDLRAEFKSIRFSWVPRELNVEADELASRAFKVS
jgi:ribonuclease HI